MKIFTCIGKSFLIHLQYLRMTFTWSDTISRYLYEYVLLAVAYILCWLRGSVVIFLGLTGFDKKFISFKTSRVWCITHVLSVYFCKWMRAYARLIYACLVSCLSQLSAVLSVHWCVHTLVCPFLNSSPPPPPPPPPPFPSPSYLSPPPFF